MTGKKVVRFDVWTSPSFDKGLAPAQDIKLQVCRLAASDQENLAILSEAHVYHITAAKDELPRRWFVGSELLERCPQLLCVSSTGAGYDPIDVAACTRAGVAVVNQAGGNAASVAEHALGLMLAVAHRITECDRRMRRERGFTREDVMGREINGKTLGIVGIGHVGTRVAALSRAFGMRVIAFDPYVQEQEIRRRGAEPMTLEALLEQADIVSLHCPRTRETTGMMNAGAFARMKQGALFVTTARGGIHDERALLQALQSGHLGGAGLDVWDTEPPPLDHPLLQLDNVAATFHTAGVTHEARSNIAAIAAEQIVQLLDGKRPPRLVNPEVWPLYAERFERLLGRRVEGLK